MEFADWLLVQRRLAHSTTERLVRRRDFAERNGLDLEVCLSGVAQAIQEGNQYLARRRRVCQRRKAWKNDAELLSLLAEWMGYEGVAWRGPRVSSQPTLPYAPEELDALVEASTRRQEALLGFSLATGLRRSDAHPLRRRDVAADWYSIPEPAKDGYRRRLRWLWPSHADVFWEIHDDQAPGEPLWPMTLESLGNTLVRLGAKAGVPCSWQRGRATFYAWMREAGLSGPTRSHYLGHRSQWSRLHYDRCTPGSVAADLAGMRAEAPWQRSGAASAPS